MNNFKAPRTFYLQPSRQLKIKITKIDKNYLELINKYTPIIILVNILLLKNSLSALYFYHKKIFVDACNIYYVVCKYLHDTLAYSNI